VHRTDNLTTFMCWLSINLGASTSSNPLGLNRHWFTFALKLFPGERWKSRRPEQRHMHYFWNFTLGKVGYYWIQHAIKYVMIVLNRDKDGKQTSIVLCNGTQWNLSFMLSSGFPKIAYYWEMCKIYKIVLKCRTISVIFTVPDRAWICH